MMNSIHWSKQEEVYAPTIKNHSVTHHDGFFYCFGGYDGRRNHNTLCVFSVSDRRWIPVQSVLTEHEDEEDDEEDDEEHYPPPHGHHNNDSDQDMDHEDMDHEDMDMDVKPPSSSSSSTSNRNNNDYSQIKRPIDSLVAYGQPPSGRNGHTATLATRIDEHGNPQICIFILGGWLGRGTYASDDCHILNITNPTKGLRWIPVHQSKSASTTTSSSNTTTNINTSSSSPLSSSSSSSLSSMTSNQDGKSTSSTTQTISSQATSPLNNDTNTNNNTNNTTTNNNNNNIFPGPMNMHSADFIPTQNEIYVFRGGDGREYFNELHALDTQTLTWRVVQTEGVTPQKRANHSSCYLEDTQELFIFGGWNGRERLNDIHILNTQTSKWYSPPTYGNILPHPRAGMTLTALRGRLYLFGGSGSSSKCFQDLHVFDRNEMRWLDVHVSSSSELDYCGSGNRRGGERGKKNRRHHQQHHQQQQHSSSTSSSSRNRGNSHSLEDGTAASTSAFDITSTGENQASISASASTSTSTAAAFDLTGIRNHGSDNRYAAISSLTTTTTPVPTEANPNENESISSVTVYGQGPGKRAGHSSTAAGRYIYIFGGSCGSHYLDDFFILDTDRIPIPFISEPTSLRLVNKGLRQFMNAPDHFADVVFVVGGYKIYAHRMILSLVSDYYQTMFLSKGWRESHELQQQQQQDGDTDDDDDDGEMRIKIPIPNCSYDAFSAMIEYIYTGEYNPNIRIASMSSSTAMGVGTTSTTTTTFTRSASTGEGELQFCTNAIEKVVETMELADQYLLDHLKQLCERKLSPAVNDVTLDYFMQVCQKTNAMQLLSVCQHVERNLPGPF